MRDEILLKQILESISKIESYVENVDYSKFEKTSEKQDAVVKRLETIGEGVKRLSNEFRKNHPEIQWGKIAGFRDKAVHDYLGIDFKAVWEIVEEDLPKLRERLEKILERGVEYGGGSSEENVINQT